MLSLRLRILRFEVVEMQPASRILLVAAIGFLPLRAMAGAEEVSFEKHIAPIFAAHCIKCHGPTKQQGGLRFDSASGALRKGDSGEPAILPANPAASEVLRRVTNEDESTR